MRPLRVQLVSLPDRNSALGTKMTALSNVPLRGPDIDAPDNAVDAAHINHVAFAQGLPEDDQKPADEVVDDVLEAKADAYGQAAGDHRDAGQAEPKRAQGV